MNQQPTKKEFINAKKIWKFNLIISSGQFIGYFLFSVFDNGIKNDPNMSWFPYMTLVWTVSILVCAYHLDKINKKLSEIK